LLAGAACFCSWLAAKAKRFIGRQLASMRWGSETAESAA
jgi:hypothetical protein